ncbi:MAG: hypothetical protein IPL16_00995 [Ignavibacteria bacterium]|nr:hypothetical protein [Ignavibacteria bacterium]
MKEVTDIMELFIVMCTNLVLRNAKIKNTSTSSSTPYSICIYIYAGSFEQFFKFENVTIVTGNTSTGQTLYLPVTGAEDPIVQNLGLFLNKYLGSAVNLQVGTAANFKYIQSSDVS